MTMSLTLRSSSNLFNENERLRRKRLTTTTLNRFLSFNENKSSAVENRRRLLQKVGFISRHSNIFFNNNSNIRYLFLVYTKSN